MVLQRGCSFLKLTDEATGELAGLAKAADAEAIDRILRAVGRGHIPPGLDRKALCADIADAYYASYSAIDPFSGSKANGELKHLRRIRKTAEKLASLVKADYRVEAMISGHLNKITPPWEKFTPPLSSAPVERKGIDRLNQMLRAIAGVERGRAHTAKEWRTAHKDNPIFRGRRPTNAEWLAGVSLPLVFEWHFRARAGRSRTKSGSPAGPMVRFISATLKELGLPYSDEAIMRAFSLRAPLRKH
jgi:hypothetical protein